MSCPNCGVECVVQGFEIICPNCGLVIDEVLRRDMSSISYFNMNHYRSFKPMESKSNGNAYRKAVYRTNTVIKYVCDSLSLSRAVRDKALETASYLITYHRSKFTNSTYIAIVSILAAVREVGGLQPIKISDVVPLVSEMGRRIKVRTLMRNLMAYNSISRVNPPMLPLYVENLLSKIEHILSLKRSNEDLKLLPIVRREAFKMAAKVPKSYYVGKRPSAIAAAVVYLSYSTVLRKLRGRKRGAITQSMLCKLAELHMSSLHDHMKALSGIISSCE